MDKLSPQNIQDLRDANPLVELIERETRQQGQKKGRWTEFFCPFHNNTDTPAS